MLDPFFVIKNLYDYSAALPSEVESAPRRPLNPPKVTEEVCKFIMGMITGNNVNRGSSIYQDRFSFKREKKNIVCQNASLKQKT